MTELTTKLSKYSSKNRLMGQSYMALISNTNDNRFSVSEKTMNLTQILNTLFVFTRVPQERYNQ